MSTREMLPEVRDAVARVEIGEVLSVEEARRLVEEIEDLEKWIDDLHSGMYVNCVYCGHQYGPADEIDSTMQQALREHVESCPKHPLSAAKRQIDELTDDLSEAHAVIEELSLGS